jgi:peptide-methionine (S)-S-oxide reductase
MTTVRIGASVARSDAEPNATGTIARACGARPGRAPYIIAEATLETPMRRLLAFAALVTFASAPVAAQDEAHAIFAGGCFWCVEADFDKVDGVLETVSGYTGGDVADPTYRQVVAGGTGHREAVRIAFDPDVVGYEELLNAFWHSVDPTDDGGQFCDRGFSYTTAIYALDAAQRAAAEASKAAVRQDLAVDATIETPILDAAEFYRAEDYHQDYYEKKPARYKFYRWSCGRNDRVREVWGETAFDGIPGLD